jgi:hypothetical protein
MLSIVLDVGIYIFCTTVIVAAGIHLGFHLFEWISLGVMTILFVSSLILNISKYKRGE